MATQTFLAMDLGAESGRGMLAGWDGTRLSLRELSRFPTGPGRTDLTGDGVRRWDIERIGGEIDAALASAMTETNGHLAGVGVDSWGVDFGLLDENGTLLEPPAHYRDPAHARAMTAAFARVPREEIWAATGIQTLAFNTLYQLAAIQERSPETLARARRLLLIPDLMHCRLTAGASKLVEATNGSTTQMLDPHSRQWRTDLLDSLGLPSHFLGALTTAGQTLGKTPGGVPVYAPPTHDTASAVLAVPARAGENWAFLSSGTWSLLGVERRQPELSLAALHDGFSNEGGVGGTTRFLKNIMGLWLVQECRRSLGGAHSYTELSQLAAAAPPGPLIDAAEPRFLSPSDMIAELQAACRDSGQTPPVEIGPVIRCCLESLALAYRRGLDSLRQLLQIDLDKLYLVGGGGQNQLLNQWTADACGLPVVVGAAEATAMGNALGQLVASGAVGSWEQAREVARQSVIEQIYEPDAHAAAQWENRL